MFLAGLFLAALARSLASPTPISVPGNPNSSPSPICVVAAASIVPQSQCDPTRTRTLFDILYSCIGVILLCTYISIHHNIPDQGATWMQVKWMRIRTTLYALLAPEFVIMWAIRERVVAGRVANKMKDHGWTRTHGFFLQMGGLVRVRSDSTYVVLQERWGVGGGGKREWNALGQCEIPRIPEKEIKDHGKGDLLAKAIVVIQTTWFVAQCIARHTQGLILTEIELVTLAFATLNVITYGLWWDKPLNVEYPIYFDEEGKRVDGPEESEEKKSEDAGHRGMWESVKEYFRGWRDSVHLLGVIVTIWKKGIVGPFSAVFGPLMDMMVERDGDDRGDNFVDATDPSDEDKEKFYAMIYGSAIGVIFGGIHLVGWNFEFPTATEQLLWRASSLVITAVPLLLAILAILGFVASNSSSDFTAVLAYLFYLLTVYVCPLVYFAARIINLFLAFYTLRALPDSAYQNVRWTEFIPHI
ncbi:hypothetical protein AX16_001943 [Volvariella volvacea WC 439]|nr:hypothetical protein AX16_001943 [Volvariella volvacea WC 439]